MGLRRISAAEDSLNLAYPQCKPGIGDVITAADSGKLIDGVQVEAFPLWKAFHYHQRQTDYWVVAAGMFQVALVDLRADSKTFGARNTLYVGALRPWRLLIPPGVGHGYKVLGGDPGVLVYLTSQKYDPADEGRIAYNDADLAYDWELQHK
jgi:dTDP-4-dehydrorhamnose 3,5-epimerase-like enzyme